MYDLELQTSFEQYAREVLLPLQKTDAGKRYLDAKTQSAWMGWQAAVKHLNGSQVLALQIARDALHYYAYMFPGIEIRDGGDVAGQALAAIDDLTPAVSP